MHQLFGAYAHRYDVHTPPGHYRHDHAAVIDVALRHGSGCKLLDVGCGTGVFLAKAREAGIDANGIDASAEMIRVAEARLGPGIAVVGRMEDLELVATHDLIVSLSWTLNYVAGRDALLDVLRRFHNALRPGGGLLVQVAHAPHVRGELLEDREPGPDGIPDDVTFTYRFEPLGGAEHAMRAEYAYRCESMAEFLREEHLLRMADAPVVAECIEIAGFRGVALFDSHRLDPFVGSPSPFILAEKG